ncbi:hypothetical protein EC988_006902, partial [Linderina pennispora]
HMHGRTCLDTLRTFFPPECHSKQFADNFENEFVNITEGVYPVPGVHPAVTAVSPERWAVVTAASRMWALARLGQVGLPEPKLLIAADDVTKGKPHPEGYLAGAKALGLEGKDVVVFEDAVSGVKAALAAGATVIALTTSTTREKLAEAGAQHIVDDFTKGILFDMDGTLVNTIDCVERFWRHKATQYNINADELLSCIHGFPTLDVLKTWFPAELHNPEGAKLFESEIMHDADGVFAVPGVPQLLASLDPKKWTIVTAATEDLALCRLGQVDLPVPAEMVSAKNVARGKPDPQCYQMGAKVLGIEPSEALVFEDAINGTKAGHAAGATVVGVLTSTPEQALKDAGAKYVIHDFANVRVEDRGDHLVISF